jgi:hypothetical protein
MPLVAVSDPVEAIPVVPAYEGLDVRAGPVTPGSGSTAATVPSRPRGCVCLVISAGMVTRPPLRETMPASSSSGRDAGRSTWGACSTCGHQAFELLQRLVVGHVHGHVFRPGIEVGGDDAGHLVGSPVDEMALEGPGRDAVEGGHPLGAQTPSTAGSSSTETNRTMAGVTEPGARPARSTSFPRRSTASPYSSGGR